MLQERGCVGDQFPQRCPRHPHIQNFATEANEVGHLQVFQCCVVFLRHPCWKMLRPIWGGLCVLGRRTHGSHSPGFVCKQLCGKAFGCGIADHVCKRQCHPDEGSHHADKCVYTVQKTYQCHESPAHAPWSWWVGRSGRVGWQSWNKETKSKELEKCLLRLGF